MRKCCRPAKTKRPKGDREQGEHAPISGANVKHIGGRPHTAQVRHTLHNAHACPPKTKRAVKATPGRRQVLYVWQPLPDTVQEMLNHTAVGYLGDLLEPTQSQSQTGKQVRLACMHASR
jgi:hypothetical protein